MPLFAEILLLASGWSWEIGLEYSSSWKLGLVMQTTVSLSKPTMPSETTLLTDRSGEEPVWTHSANHSLWNGAAGILTWEMRLGSEEHPPGAYTSSSSRFTLGMRCAPLLDKLWSFKLRNLELNSRQLFLFETTVCSSKPFYDSFPKKWKQHFVLACFVIVDYFQKSLAFILQLSFWAVCFSIDVSAWKHHCVSD